MSLIEKEPILRIFEAAIEKENNTAHEYALKGADYAEYYAKYTHGAFCYLQARKVVEKAPTIDFCKLQRVAEITVQFVIDGICEHRKNYGLDPVWFPSLSWCSEKFYDVFESFKTEGCTFKSDEIGVVNPYAEAEKWHAEYHKNKNELVREKAYQRESAKLADKYFVELKKLPGEIFSELWSCVDYIEEQLPEGVLPSAFVSLKEDIAALEKKYGVSEN